MQSEPLVSVIVPCYNQGAFLNETLESVFLQTYHHWECIIVNDGSVDNTGDVARKWVEKDSRFKYFHQKNRGVSYARNLGVQHSNGEFIQLLDGDDKLEDDKLRLQVNFLLGNDGVDIVYGSSRYFIDGHFDEKFIIHTGGDIPTVDVQYTDKHQTAALLMKNFATICAPLYRRSVFHEHQFENIVFEDWFFHIECSLRKKKFHFERMAGSTCFIRLSEGSQMHRHKKIHENSPEVFAIRLKALLASYGYEYPYKMTIIQNSSRVKETVKSFIPPVVMKIWWAARKAGK